SPQGDKKIIDILREFGAEVSVKKDIATVKHSNLHGIKVDASDIPDLVPIICAVACNADGETVITNAERLRIKESDRIKSVVEMITNLGGKIKETADGMIVTGNLILGGEVNSCNDHRIAMTAAVLSSIAKNPIKIIQAEAVNKSYPHFFDDFKILKGSLLEVK
ncbi:MAG: 3-phosphoshikimate 1-carboxyvinyltransferase, partial [Acutalibacteraceae bacterium]